MVELEKLRCIIADDERSARELLEKHIKKIPYLELVAQCSNASEALTKIAELRPDIIFLDIQMPGLNGLELISLLPSVRPKIIVVSGDPQFAVEGFNLQVTDYILKPLTFERMARAVLKAKSELNKHQETEHRETFLGHENAVASSNIGKEDDFLLVKDSKKLIRIDLDKIHLVEAMKDYLKIYWGSGITVLHQTMGRIEEKLPAASYLRVHRSFIVSKKIIAEINGNEIITTTGKTIPIGSTYRETILKEFSDNIL
ncbi:DNA-binding response regulator [Dyadobacter beijingensis]|uniref:DNA-binding response regulator n=1 Tax=Dyadobacter beijingensis TaxID=365489 RepID=A0ABQ2HK09_9BACT|nr:response regulator [Dyadobacter beijingensis]GGM82530.1 DNA-binding response regulator [Dyadobacter beijingensis]